MGRFRKPVGPRGPRGFESPPLRHLSERARRAGPPAPARGPRTPEPAPPKAAPPAARVRARGLAVELWRIDRCACGCRLRPGRESTRRIGARSVAQTPRCPQPQSAAPQRASRVGRFCGNDRRRAQGRRRWLPSSCKVARPQSASLRHRSGTLCACAGASPFLRMPSHRPGDRRAAVALPSPPLRSPRSPQPRPHSTGPSRRRAQRRRQRSAIPGGRAIRSTATCSRRSPPPAAGRRRRPRRSCSCAASTSR